MNMNTTVDNIYNAYDWLRKMDTVAQKMGVRLMYDSPLASQILQSSHMKSAVQGSALMDYNPGMHDCSNSPLNSL
jgi:hypothetical protein